MAGHGRGAAEIWAELSEELERAHNREHHDIGRPMSAAEVCQLSLAEADEVLGPLLIAGSRLVVGGHTGHGKTTLVMQMVRAITGVGDFLGWEGDGRKVLMVDLEQGLRTVQRRLRESGLSESTLVDVLRVPDGMSLDRHEQEREALREIIAGGDYGAVVLDPLYKLHGGDSNDERAMVDLMRVLDGWRAEHGFALIIPMHLRKPPPQGAALSMHDVFGSAGVVRGAEVVIGIERMSDGFSRLHWWKDRDGDLPIGEKWGLLYDREHGYRRDPKDGERKVTTAERLRELLSWNRELSTLHLVTALDVSERTVRTALKKLGALSREGDREGLSGGRAELMWSLPSVLSADDEERYLGPSEESP